MEVGRRKLDFELAGIREGVKTIDWETLAFFQKGVLPKGRFTKRAFYQKGVLSKGKKLKVFKSFVLVSQKSNFILTKCQHMSPDFFS